MYDNHASMPDAPLCSLHTAIVADWQRMLRRACREKINEHTTIAVEINQIWIDALRIAPPSVVIGPSNCGSTTKHAPAQGARIYPRMPLSASFR